jgi:hypothetical protein
MWPWLAAGLIMRAVAFFFAHPIGSGDAHAYLILAQSVASGRGLVINDPVYGRIAGVYPPAYPLLLAAFGSVFGVGPASAATLNAILDCVSARLLAKINGTAAVVFFCWPSLILNSVVPQKESLEIAFVIGLVLASRSTWPGAAALFGALSAMLVLTQPMLLFFPMAIWIMFRPSGAIFSIATATAIMFPWWVRNFLLFGSFVPLTTASGLSLAVSTSGGYFPPPQSLANLPEPERFAQVGRIALNQIIADPARYIWSVSRNAVGAVVRDDFTLWRAVGQSWILIPLDLLRGQLLVLAACGRNPLAIRTVICAAIAILPGIFFEFDQRHLYFILPFLFVLAAEFPERLSKWAADRSPRWATPPRTN